MKPLDKSLRRSLEAAVVKARDIAEAAAREDLQRLTVGDAVAGSYLNDEQRKLRNRLRAHGRQLGDMRKSDAIQSIEHLVAEVAYEHWHRMLFARFLAENNLLMYEDGVTPLSLQDCFDLAKDEGGEGWEYAARYAAKMLPQIFRPDSPAFEITFAPNHQHALEKLLMNLDAQTFQASDALGWVYQFWQSKKKEQVNASEVKIGADELPAVTQLFTEPYMVSFLLDNSLGAWWAARRLSEIDFQTASSEEALRRKASIPAVPLEYLRFIKSPLPEGEGLCWQPAAGMFDAWPEHLSELKTLDPCCGSGHFLVAAFLMLVPMRMEMESLSAKEAVDAVLRDNIHGLELDQRCVELAAFAVAIAAWKYPDAGGYRTLPELQLACSGLSVSVAKEEWKKLGMGKKNLSIALDWMHDIFNDAPVLGSLLNPAKSNAAQLVPWDELSAIIEQALAQEQTDEQQEVAVIAQGLSKAATLLAGQYQWVITNVPYLSRGKQHEVLRDYCEKHYPAGKNDLATVFLDRCLELCVQGGTASIVLPQNWLFLTSYKKFREKLLRNNTWHLIARLGAQAFQTPMWDFNVQLINMSRGNASCPGLMGSGRPAGIIRGVDVSEPRTAAEKAASLLTTEIKSVEQAKQLANPDARVTLEKDDGGTLLLKYAICPRGIVSGDGDRWVCQHWEVVDYSGCKWKYFQGTTSENSL